MKGLVVLGSVLIVLGIAGLVFGGITYTRDRDTANLGPVDITIEDKERLALHPALGGVVLLAGIVVVYVGARRK